MNKRLAFLLQKAFDRDGKLYLFLPMTKISNDSMVCRPRREAWSGINPRSQKYAMLSVLHDHGLTCTDIHVSRRLHRLKRKVCTSYHRRAHVIRRLMEQGLKTDDSDPLFTPNKIEHYRVVPLKLALNQLELKLSQVSILSMRERA